MILLPSKTTTTEKSQRDGGCGPCGIKVTVRRLRGKRGRANERRGRRGEDRRVRYRGEGGVAKLSAEEGRSEGWRRRGWWMMQEGEPIVLLT